MAAASAAPDASAAEGEIAKALQRVHDEVEKYTGGQLCSEGFRVRTPVPKGALGTLRVTLHGKPFADVRMEESPNREVLMIFTQQPGVKMPFEYDSVPLMNEAPARYVLNLLASMLKQESRLPRPSMVDTYRVRGWWEDPEPSWQKKEPG